MSRRSFISLGLALTLHDDSWPSVEQELSKSVSSSGRGAMNSHDNEDASPYLQGILDSGASLSLPAGKRFYCKSGLILKFDGQLISGGEFCFDDDIVGCAAFRVLSNRVEFSSVKIFNLSRRGLAVGGKTTGIYIEGDDSFVHACTIDGFQMGICVAPNGEHFRHRIHGNSVTNVVGSGGGPKDKVSSLGEDRGDGITVWGAVATIIGNVVTAMPGTDARCGIFFEALKNYKKGSNGLEDDSFCVISGNSVSGPFRRSIDCEEIDNCVISSNICSSGVWAVIQVSQGSRNCVVIGNAIRFSRNSDDYTGQAWAPWRCAINVYSDARNITLSGNSIENIGYGHGIHLNGLSGRRVSNVSVYGNILDFANRGVGSGVVCSFGHRVRILNNKIVNMIEGPESGPPVFIFDSEDVVLSHNEIEGSGGVAISLLRVGGLCEISSNHIYSNSGLDVRQVAKAYIKGNYFFVKKQAVNVVRSDRVLISDNVFPSDSKDYIACDGLSLCNILGNYD